MIYLLEKGKINNKLKNYYFKAILHCRVIGKWFRFILSCFNKYIDYRLYIKCKATELFCSYFNFNLKVFKKVKSRHPHKILIIRLKTLFSSHEKYALQ